MDELLRMLTFEVIEQLYMLEMFCPKLSAYEKCWKVKLTIVQKSSQNLIYKCLSTNVFIYLLDQFCYLLS